MHAAWKPRQPFCPRISNHTLALPSLPLAGNCWDDTPMLRGAYLPPHPDLMLYCLVSPLSYSILAFKTDLPSFLFMSTAVAAFIAFRVQLPVRQVLPFFSVLLLYLFRPLPPLDAADISSIIFNHPTSRII
ncbi:hypothetical protein BU24DRAFT_99726 [Aaosphaeria arxii CBS 175.79]|uniref:Uncharacterized protein n=1 Tax=Aaosphaeria arxii CBS 175.79 TaxID=1450172 RepID=A0A6A5XZ46_9PLEO|nr:uncharacterized protein BU24DRAFT_99726 [Aaosphaeria arxii CBS 175.79]KAF2018568.1 hypothetical protein BU24DRAFT_99726 [Aaosphaeria arxii CBS 175.79]